MQHNKKKLTNKQIRSLTNEYINGEGSRILGRRYNLSFKEVIRILRKERYAEVTRPDVVIRPADKPPLPEVEKAICSLYKKGNKDFNITGLSRIFRVGYSSIRRTLVRNGLIH